MPYLLVAFAVLVLLAVLAGCGAKEKPAATKPDDATPVPTVKDASADKNALTREQLVQRLRDLAKSEPPKTLAFGAECYKTASLPTSNSHVCSKCGQTTLHALPDAASEAARAAVWQIQLVLDRELPACRRTIKEIVGLTAELDDTQFCKKCSPDAAKPQLVLVVRVPGQTEPQRTAGVTANDLRLIKEFLAGSAKHVGAQDMETPLKNHLPRLEQLLGVKP